MYYTMQKGMNTPLTTMVRYTFPSKLNRLLPRCVRRKKIKKQKTKKILRSVAATGATCCSAGVRSCKEKKNWREAVKYLHSRIDRARILRREGSVITCDLAALRQVKENQDAGQRQRQQVAVGYCSCGAAYPSRVQHGGNREVRRRRQRANRERLRDIRTVSRTLREIAEPFSGW